MISGASVSMDSHVVLLPSLPEKHGYFLYVAVSLVTFDVPVVI